VPSGDQALALGGADRLAQVGLAGAAELALAALGGIEGNDVIARFDRGHSWSDFFHDTGAFMAQDGREHAFGIGAREGVGIGVAHAGGDDAHQRFACLRALYVHFFDRQRGACFPGDGSTGFHRRKLLRKGSRTRLRHGKSCVSVYAVSSPPFYRMRKDRCHHAIITTSLPRNGRG